MIKFFFLFILCFCLSPLAQAQKALPIVHATDGKTFIQEGDYVEKISWYLDPSARPDVFRVSKSKKPIRLSLHTDIDSIHFKLKPGETFDFIVLLNGKDSCYNRFVSPTPIKRHKKVRPITRDTIPFVLHEQNAILFDAQLDGQKDLKLTFDFNATGLSLLSDAIDDKSWLQTRDHSIKIGNLSWENLGIREARLLAHGANGRIGPDAFNGRLLEIDYNSGNMIVHSALKKRPKGYKKFDLSWRQSHFQIQGQIDIKGQPYPYSFILDNGFNRSILLDSILLKEQNFPEDLKVLKTNSLRNSQGKEFITNIVSIDALTLGDFTLEEVPALVLNTPNPAGFKTHFIGNGLLKRFNLILDFQKDRIYLKPNDLWEEPYYN